MSLGLEQAGIDITDVVEIDSAAAGTYNENFPHTTVHVESVTTFLEKCKARYNLMKKIRDEPLKDQLAPKLGAKYPTKEIEVGDFDCDLDECYIVADDDFRERHVNIREIKKFRKSRHLPNCYEYYVELKNGTTKWIIEDQVKDLELVETFFGQLPEPGDFELIAGGPPCQVSNNCKLNNMK